MRRGKRGSRPSIIRAGPRGRTKGDEEQWAFKDVVLEDWEKRMVVAEVVSIATRAMFHHHYYKFGGTTYHQAQGGPIGLRGTCAIAKLAMQMFDGMWGDRLENLGIRTWLRLRYVDDGKVALQPIKPGWRWHEGGQKFCKRWEMEDQEQTDEYRTKEVIRMTLMGSRHTWSSM